MVSLEIFGLGKTEMLSTLELLLKPLLASSLIPNFPIPVAYPLVLLELGCCRTTVFVADHK
jgi:hypothetical protein